MKLVSEDTFGITTTWAEARGESQRGQIAVAEVIQRRAALKYFSDGTVAGTVLRPSQFSCWRTSDPNFPALLRLDDGDPAVASCMAAWAAAKLGPPVVPDALLYANLSILPTPPAWVAKTRLVAKIGSHSFFALA